MTGELVRRDNASDAVSRAVTTDALSKVRQLVSDAFDKADQVGGIGS